MRWNSDASSLVVQLLTYNSQEAGPAPQPWHVSTGNDRCLELNGSVEIT